MVQDTDCSKDIVPDHLICAKPERILWNKQNREVGCCQVGFYPTANRYCTRDPAAWDKRFVQIFTCVHLILQDFTNGEIDRFHRAVSLATRRSQHRFIKNGNFNSIHFYFIVFAVFHG